MTTIEEIFKHKAFIKENLIDYGFTAVNDELVYQTPIMSGEFILKIRISASGNITDELYEIATGEIYLSHKIADFTGGFVADIRKEYESVLNDIAEKCCNTEIFKSVYTKELIARVQNVYSAPLEFLWEKFPDNAIFRRADNKKWFAVILTVKREKLGITGDGIIEIAVIRAPSNDIPDIIDNKEIFPGYHMNKKNWISIPLDDRTPLDKTFEMLKTSYDIAAKK